MTTTAQTEDACVCAPDGPCLGVPGDTDECPACLTLDPELDCLAAPEGCICGETYGPEDCPVHDEESEGGQDWRKGCDCTELCSMGPTCPGGSLARLPGSGCWRTKPDESATIRDLIERGSLGTPEAKALRASVTDEQAAAIVRRAEELRTDPNSPPPWER